ncbi:UreF-domain-containing protein [Abortiporus biennis]|nr:UreF-domain-containing protein [Abortiporus biennis]
MDNDEEAYILLLLSDGNLPTGSFVASAGLESYATHGFLSPLPEQKGKDKVACLVDFIRNSLSTYARNSLPFVHDVMRVVQQIIDGTSSDESGWLDRALQDLSALDDLYETMTLNHVSRRASKSQGVALLTLYSKGFSKPKSSIPREDIRQHRISTIVDKFKLMIRREDTHGHLPVCWGVLTGALGLSLERSQFLHLFLHARSLLSAAVRMNTIGPYASQQLLLHTVRPLVFSEAKNCSHLCTESQGPAMTWPLGEILAGRHDLQHSRIFNS